MTFLRAAIQTIVRDYTYPYIWYLGGVENTKPTLYKIDISGNREEDYTQSSFDYSIINTDARIWKRDISGVVTHIQTDSNLQIFGIIQPYNPYTLDLSSNQINYPLLFQYDLSENIFKNVINYDYTTDQYENKYYTTLPFIQITSFELSGDGKILLSGVAYDNNNTITTKNLRLIGNTDASNNYFLTNSYQTAIDTTFGVFDFTNHYRQGYTSFDLSGDYLTRYVNQDISTNLTTVTSDIRATSTLEHTLVLKDNCAILSGTLSTPDTSGSNVVWISKILSYGGLDYHYPDTTSYQDLSGFVSSTYYQREHYFSISTNLSVIMI